MTTMKVFTLCAVVLRMLLLQPTINERVTVLERSQANQRVSFVNLLERIGDEQNRYFTIEQASHAGESVNWLEAKMVSVPAKLAADKGKNQASRQSWDVELQKLRSLSPGISFNPDPIRPNVIHVLDDRVRKVPRYALSVELQHFTFDGSISSFTDRLARLGIRIQSQRVFVIGGPPIFMDTSTELTLSDFTGTVREGMTVALPLETYGRVPWIASTHLTQFGGQTQIDFRGPRKRTS